VLLSDIGVLVETEFPLNSEKRRAAILQPVMVGPDGPIRDNAEPVTRDESSCSYVPDHRPR